MNNKKVIDTADFQKELDLIQDRSSLLGDRFIALAMDYKDYIDASFKQDKIYTLRDGVLFRLFSANFHVKLLFDHLLFADQRIKQEQGLGFNAGLYSRQITALFDSFIYHTVSVFDYLATLTNYISGTKKKEATLMWTQLAKSVRDENNAFSKTRFSEVIDQIDRNFVCKLYDYRSFLIHRRTDMAGYKVTYTPGANEEIVAVIFAGKHLIKSFKDLKVLSEENDLTVRYVALWILGRAIDKITDILFSLKNEIESKSKGSEPMMTFVHPETNERLSASVMYWNEIEYKRSRELPKSV